MARAKRRKDGRYGAKVTIAKGKVKYVCANTQKELDEKVTQLKLKVGKGLDIGSERETFDEWGQRWLLKKRHKVSEKWYTALTINYKKLEPIYNYTVSRLKAIDLEEILDSLAEQQYSARVIKAVRDIAIGIMQMCTDNRVIDYNPFSAAETPKATPKKTNDRRALTPEEQSWIRDTPHRAQLPAMIMMYAGLRRGELLALQWSDIDLNEHTITVRRTVNFDNADHPVIKNGGKTANAERIVYIPQRLVDFLAVQPHTSLYVVPAASGKLMSASAWRSLWNSYIKDLNLKYGDFSSIIKDGKPMERPQSKTCPGGVPIIIPQFTAHWLRHTYITLLYMSGVDVLTAAKQAGHSDVKTTMDIYTHLDAEHVRKNIDRLDNFLENSTDCEKGMQKVCKTADKAAV